MTNLAIKVDNLSKRYRIGLAETQHDTLFGAVKSWVMAPFANYRNLRKLSHFSQNGYDSTTSLPGASNDIIWALKDISFEVEQGEVVGIIGRNGAGKSTLLKILSRITEPNSGRAVINGRVASLLEVGTGFHPELTGRENIYLNGTVLGMTKTEIDRKFDEIVDFSGVEKFIDTPVKRYSSGMQVRLAFAVAAHLEPEILLIDEVLAVGDADFQKKCLGKMGDVAKGGRTVLFVSHNLGQVKRLCHRGLWIDQGSCQIDGSVDDAIMAYESSLTTLSKGAIEAEGIGEETGFISWRIGESPAEEPYIIRQDGPVTLEVILRIDRPVQNAYNGLALFTADGSKVAGWGLRGLKLEPGVYKLSYRFPGLPVRPGSYRWFISCWDAGKKIDKTYLHPELLVSTQDHSGGDTGAKGVVNMPCEIEVKHFVS